MDQRGDAGAPPPRWSRPTSTFLGPNPPTELGGLAAVADVLASGATAVLAYNDLVAIGLIEGLAARGVDVPGEISVIGVDDIVPGRLSRPKLTTVAMPTAAAGRIAVDLLLQSVDSESTGGVTVLETDLDRPRLNGKENRK